jgi:hypothetical protein
MQERREGVEREGEKKGKGGVKKMRKRGNRGKRGVKEWEKNRKEGEKWGKKGEEREKMRIEGTRMRGELKKGGEGRRGGEGEHSCMRAGIGLF